MAPACLCGRRRRTRGLEDAVRRWKTRRLATSESLPTGEQDEDHEDHDMTREDLIRVAVARGDSEILEVLADANLWDPRYCVDELQAADEAGTLLRLCKAFYLPQALCPTLAHLQDTCKEKWTECAAEENTWRPASRPTPPAMLLANMIAVSCPVIDEVMEDIVEDMVVFMPGSKGKPLPSIPLHRDFPKSLGAVFLRPTAEVDAINIRYDKLSKLNMLEHWPNEGDTAAISDLFDITLDAEARRAALIPTGACKFAYVYEQKRGLPGGFVYVRETKSGKIKVLEVNCIDFNVQGHALSFGKSTPFSEEACEELRGRGALYRVPVEELTDRGAIEYAFVGPGQDIADFRGTPGGGFVYLIAGEQGQGGHYFPILGAGQVMIRAEIPASSSLNAAVLDEGADGCALQGSLAHHRRGASCQRRRAHDLLACFARLRVPGVLHPVVLHSLAITPRPQVLSTRAAQAITQAAFSQHHVGLAVDTLAEAVSLVAISMITSKVRVYAWENPLSYKPRFWDTVLVLVWLKKTFDEVCVFLGYYYQGWMSDYISWEKSSFWLYLIGMLLCWLWLATDLWQEYEADSLRPLIAAVGAANWVRLLYAFRGTSAFGLGPRILPIMYTLGEMVNFVLVTVFFTGACAHVSFALSGNRSPLSEILFSSYRLGFLGHFDITQDVLSLHDGESEPHSWSPFQYIAFVVFSFTVSISVTNIFIGVMSNAFDYHSERVGELFARTRASMALERSLRAVGLRLLCNGLCGLRLTSKCARALSQDSRLWFCFKRVEEDNAEFTMRGAVKSMRDTILHRLEDFGKLNDLVKQLEDMQKLDDLARLLHEGSAPGPGAGGGAGGAGGTPSCRPAVSLDCAKSASVAAAAVGSPSQEPSDVFINMSQKSET